MTSIAYGVPLDMNNDTMDIEKPLLEADNHHEDNETDDNNIPSHQSNQVMAASLMVGATLGFCFQCLSLGSDVLLTTYFDATTTSLESTSEWAVYYGISALSYSWYLLFPMVIVCMAHATNRAAIRWVQASVMDRDTIVYTPEARRMTFVAAVCLLEGVVLGCSGSWSMLAWMLDLAPVLMGSLSVATLVCLALCQGMIVVYDCFHPTKTV